MTEWTAPYPAPPPPPEPIVPFGTVLTRIIMLGGLEAVAAVVSVLGEDEENAGRLLNAIEGIYPTDQSARALLTAAQLDPDIILAHPDVTP